MTEATTRRTEKRAPKIINPHIQTEEDTKGHAELLAMMTSSHAEAQSLTRPPRYTGMV
ncbi:hypothetical protein NBRC116598_33130 [Pseudophaeobacter arcticus]|uniref:Uncharacterized protein n=1 Tax=Pseudophaeobacter arcticus TaxID=385492 RepID=A0ABQ0APR2_9RHOB